MASPPASQLLEDAELFDLSAKGNFTFCVSLLGTPDLSGLTPTQFTPSAFFAGPREHIAAEPWARRGA